MIDDLRIEAGIHYNKGTSYLLKGNIKKAYQLIKKALDIFKFKEGYVNIGNCYRKMGLDAKMMESYRMALDDSIPYLEAPRDIKSDTTQHALNNLGLACFMYGNDDEAIKYYKIAIKRDPTFWEAWWNCSTATLRKASSGNVELFPSGWEMYNSRFLKSDPIQIKNSRSGLKYWEPGTRVGSILVLAEQGIGDNIMFGRYLSSLSAWADKIYVQCDSSTKEIFSDYVCVEDAIQLDHVDCAYPMCSLAGALGGIPAGDWLRGKFGTREFGPGFHVGIVWSGSSTHANDLYRSVNIGRFRNLAKHCNLYNLTPSSSGVNFVKDLGIKSWSDTAACINGLDLVIGVDTSVMHMCGSLGCPGWLLQPYKETDFRWGNGVEKSVWYDSIRIFENKQSWEVLFDNVEAALVKHISG